MNFLIWAILLVLSHVIYILSHLNHSLVLPPLLSFSLKPINSTFVLTFAREQVFSTHNMLPPYLVFSVDLRFEVFLTLLL